MEFKLQDLTNVPEFRNDREGLEALAAQSAAELQDSLARLQEETVKRCLAEEALRKSAATLRQAQRIAHLGIWELDLEKNELSWSDEIYRIFGLPPQEFGATYEAFLEALYPEDREAVNTAYKRSMEEDIPYDIIHRIVRKSTGEIRYVHEHCEHTRDETGRIIRSLGTVHDITELQLAQENLRQQAFQLKNEIEIRRQAQNALHKSERFLNMIIETEPECVKMLDRNGNLLMMNRAGLAMIEADSLDQVKGGCVYPMISPEYREAFFTLNDAIFRGESGNLVFEMVGLKGRRLWLNTHAVPFRDESGEVVAQLGITRDITEQKTLEAQLFQAQKMEAIGRLAGGVAHDFNNILTAIIGFSNVMDMSMDADDPQRQNLKHVLASADRAADLTKSLLAFSRKQIINPQPVDLNLVISKMERFLHRVIGEDIEISTTLHPDVLTVNVDSGQIEQVLMNLATNARDAMPAGGELSVETGRVAVCPSFIKANGYGKAGEYAVISVTDTGTGMDEGTSERVFEPFFTTKEVGEGTGLGMSIVYGIVKQHDGYINVCSNVGVGTTFTIYLPLIREAIVEKATVADEVLRGGTETILVADDDASLRELVVKVLSQAGYTVITAANGDDALIRFCEHKERIALVILDIIMPRMNGKKVLDEISSICPDCKALLVSGYTADIIHKRGILDDGLEFISKPLIPRQLLKKVREILDGSMVRSRAASSPSNPIC